MKLKNCVTGQRVQAKEYQAIGSGIFKCECWGVQGTILSVLIGQDYDVTVVFDNGITENGNHTNLRKVK